MKEKEQKRSDSEALETQKAEREEFGFDGVDCLSSKCKCNPFIVKETADALKNNPVAVKNISMEILDFYDNYRSITEERVNSALNNRHQHQMC
ncbi:hypothetical protein RJ641_030020 [Dillenia turbinata]|uniref:Uncharacterized protein n=1 Tax=Dillenia turbinata TaxID=194707 RepID=A0AAN8VZB9_9MAGN